jgi:hypothetical protein
MIFMPPVHFSMVTLQRGTIAKFMLGAAGIPVLGAVIPDDIIPVGLIMAVIARFLQCFVPEGRRPTTDSGPRNPGFRPR